MNLEPNGSRIVVELIEEKERASGIVLPETQKRPTRGRVIAVGGGDYSDRERRRIPLDFAVGDVVIFDRFSGTEHRLPDMRTVFILRAAEVLAWEVAE